MSEPEKRLVVNSDKALVECDKALYELFQKHKYFTITVNVGRNRSLEQNKLWGAMYKRVDQTLGWGFKHVRAHCKWYCGMFILKRDFPGFAESFGRVFQDLNEEAALRLMNANKLFPHDGFPVTRHFNTRQGAEYTESIVEEFIPHGVRFDDLLEGE